MLKFILKWCLIVVYGQSLFLNESRVLWSTPKPVVFYHWWFKTELWYLFVGAYTEHVKRCLDRELLPDGTFRAGAADRVFNRILTGTKGNMYLRWMTPHEMRKYAKITYERFLV